MAKIHELDIKAGDRILIDDAIEGIVVFSSLTDSYSVEYPKETRSSADNDGIMIVQENGARIFHDTEILESADCRVQVIERKCTP